MNVFSYEKSSGLCRFQYVLATAFLVPEPGRSVVFHRTKGRLADAMEETTQVTVDSSFCPMRKMVQPFVGYCLEALGIWHLLRTRNYDKYYRNMHKQISACITNNILIHAFRAGSQTCNGDWPSSSLLMPPIQSYLSVSLQMKRATVFEEVQKFSLLSLQEI